MHSGDRAEIYLRRGRNWTPSMDRRFRHKQYAEIGRDLAALQASDPHLTLCGHHVREFCVGCLMCLNCDGCDCTTT